MITIQRTKAYLVNTSRGEPIQIDQEEIEKVVRGMENGSVIVVKRGIINPSYFVSITEDKERITAWWHDKKYDQGAPLKALKSMYPRESTLGEAIAKTYERLKAGEQDKLEGKK